MSDHSTDRRPRVVFMGTGTFAAPSLTALLGVGYDVVAVYTKPPGTIGRGRTRTAANPVRDIAAAHGIPVEDPTGPLRDDATLACLTAYAPDVIVVAAYGKILPQRVLDLPRHGCLNVHGSLLPRWRGASPIQAALIAGDTTTGVTLMCMDAGLDTGPVIATAARAIPADVTLPTLYTQLADDGATLLTTTLPGYLNGTVHPIPQSVDGVTICRTMTRDDGRIDWTATAAAIVNLARGTDPWPGTFALWQHNATTIRVKLLGVTATDTTPHDAPGTVTITADGTILIATVDNTLRVDRLQIEGRRAMTGTELRNGYRAIDGATLA